MFLNKNNSMKYLFAFTLAEILITLLIVGVISSIVIPAVIQDSQNAELKAAWKKTYSDIYQAASRAAQDNAGTLAGLITTDDNSLLYMLKSYLSMTKECLRGSSTGICWHSDNTWYYLNGNLADNSYMSYTLHSWASGAILSNGALLKFVTTNEAMCSSGLCGWILVDVNGFKKPNIIGKDIFGT
jgi:type II secretory pathway pseudopilin PulG